MDPKLLKNPTLAVVAAIYGILWAMTGVAGPIFGAPMAFLLLLSLCRYGYELLRNTARGRICCLFPRPWTGPCFSALPGSRWPTRPRPDGSR